MNEDTLGACEVCWTNSWEPCEEEECDASHPHEGECVRCLCCWQRSYIMELSAEVAALREQAWKYEQLQK